jgi:transglutaminase-like putative cysteine protease
MDISIQYTTTFRYASPVRESQNIVRACPVDEPGQELVRYRIETDPSSRILHHRDAWGTRIDTFGILEPHRWLTIRAHAEVRTSQRPVPPDDLAVPVDEDYRLSHMVMSRVTKHTTCNESMAEAAREMTAGVERPIEKARAVRAAVADRFEYRPGVTHVGIDLIDVWDAGAGVCQDFAHVSIALLRSLGLAARYVSGYLYASNPIDPDSVSAPIETQTHAWVEVALPGWGWWPIDPSNGGDVGERHVVIGRGRDYDDVSPIRGVYFGDDEQDCEAVVKMAVAEQ